MNLDKLKGHVPDTVIAQIPDVMTKFEINTPLRLAHFLAQCGHESGGFKLSHLIPSYNHTNLSRALGCINDRVYHTYQIY